MSHVTTHVLDAALGLPASGIPVALTGPDGALIALAQTDADGRVTDFGPELLRRGTTGSSSRSAPTSPPPAAPPSTRA